MKKNLIALAVAGALAVPAAAMAEATIYGKFHVSIDSYDNDSDVVADEASGVAVSSNSSRIGFKGSEDLGSGLSAIWQTESTIGVDGSGNSLSGRNTYLGLKGGFGTLMAGKHDSPVKTIGRKVDLFGDQVGDSRSIISGGGELDPRNSDMIMYVTPAMGALQGAIQYVPDENDDDTADQTHLSAAGWYNAGPLYVGLGYSSDEDTGTGPGTGPDEITTVRVVGAYQMDALKITGLVQTVSDIDRGNAGGVDADMYGLGAAFKMGGGNTIKGQYYMADIDGDEGAVMAVGFDHAMSKQTSVYAAYAVADIDFGGVTSPWEYTGHEDLDAAVGGEGASVLSVGMIHKF